MSSDFDLNYIIETKSFKATDFIIFIDELRNKIKYKIFLVGDNAMMHHAKVVQDYLVKHHKILLFYIQKYEPDINQVELFNNALKTYLIFLPAMKADDLIDTTYKL